MWHDVSQDPDELRRAVETGASGTRLLAPTLSELPEVESMWFEFPDENNPLGVKGAGGNGIIGAPATLANAVADALALDGVVLTRLPLTPNNLRALLRAAAA